MHRKGNPCVVQGQIHSGQSLSDFLLLQPALGSLGQLPDSTIAPACACLGVFSCRPSMQAGVMLIDHDISPILLLAFI